MVTENEKRNALGPIIKDGYSVPSPRSAFVESLQAKLNSELDLLCRETATAIGTRKRPGIVRASAAKLLAHWRVATGVAVVILMALLIFPLAFKRTRRTDSTVGEKLAVATRESYGWRNASEHAREPGDGSLQQVATVKTRGRRTLAEKVASAPLIVRAEATSVDRTTFFKRPPLTETTVRFRIINVLKGGQILANLS